MRFDIDLWPLDDLEDSKAREIIGLLPYKLQPKVGTNWSRFLRIMVHYMSYLAWFHCKIKGFDLRMTLESHGTVQLIATQGRNYSQNLAPIDEDSLE